MNRNGFALLPAAATLALVLGFAYGATFNEGCSEIKDSPFGCAEYMLARYQTLIAMFGAIFIGIYAVQPVLKQLRLASLQTTVILHQVYSAREKMLEQRARSQLNALERLVSELNHGSQYLDDSNASHWVWDTEQNVDGMIRRLRKVQTQNLDGDETTVARKQLIDKLKQLSSCMSDYNSSVYMDDPGHETTDEVRTQIATAEANAAKELPRYIEYAIEAISHLRHAFEADLSELRLKRQLIDQTLVNVDLP